MLDPAELLVDLISEDLAEKAHISILARVLLNSVDNRPGPLNNQLLQPVALIKIGVHELFHGFTGLFGLGRFLVMPLFLQVDVPYQVPQLLQSQLPGLKVRGHLRRRNLIAHRLVYIFLLLNERLFGGNVIQGQVRLVLILAQG